MSTENRVLADALYSVLEEMLFLAVTAMQSSPRRETNRERFRDVVEQLLANPVRKKK